MEREGKGSVWLEAQLADMSYTAPNQTHYKNKLTPPNKDKSFLHAGHLSRFGKCPTPRQTRGEARKECGRVA